MITSLELTISIIWSVSQASEKVRFYLSNFPKVLVPVAEELNLYELSPGEEEPDETVLRENSYDQGGGNN
jgi:hypothetical protein